jgi:hypothetical protein
LTGTVEELLTPDTRALLDTLLRQAIGAANPNNILAFKFREDRTLRWEAQIKTCLLALEFKRIGYCPGWFPERWIISGERSSNPWGSN